MAADSVVGGGHTLLIQFAKEPVAGKVKTRMLPALSEQEAQQLHTELVHWVTRTLVRSKLGPVQLAVAGSVHHPTFVQCVTAGVEACVTQQGVDLGERMYCALRGGLVQHSKVVLVGSDCPEMDKAYLEEAIAALDEVPVVLGAAGDGGFVLIGARTISREAFAGVEWGTAQVLAQTRVNLERSGTPFAILRPLQDIDRPADLAHWQRLKQQAL